MTSVAERFGNLDRIRAPTPAVIAVEALVPVPCPYQLPPPVDLMSTPGAETNICGPVTETSAWLPLRSVAPTATTLSYRAGHPMVESSGLLPTPATTTTPACWACSMAARRAVVLDSWREIEMTWTPRCTAASIPVASTPSSP